MIADINKTRYHAFSFPPCFHIYIPFFKNLQHKVRERKNGYHIPHTSKLAKQNQQIVTDIPCKSDAQTEFHCLRGIINVYLPTGLKTV